MDEILLELLQSLHLIGETNEELYDSVASEAMTDAIHYGFFKPHAESELPHDYGMYSEAANLAVREALATFLEKAIAHAEENGMGFQARLAAFQNSEVTYGPSQVGYNDFFRYTSPDDYDADGNRLPE